MKKLIAILVVLVFLLSGCSMFRQAGSLADKLSMLDRTEGGETPSSEPEETPSAMPVPLPENISFEMLDPYDMLHEGWTLTREQAEGEYGMEQSQKSEYYYSGTIPQLFPGTATEEDNNSNAIFDEDSPSLSAFGYNYYIDRNIPQTAYHELLMAASMSAEQQLSGKYESRYMSYRDAEYEQIWLDNEDMTASDFLAHMEEVGASSYEIQWNGVRADGDAAGHSTVTQTGYLRGAGEIQEIELDIYYYPDEVSEQSASAAPTPSPTSEATQAATSTPSAAATSAPQIGQVKFMGMVIYEDLPPGEGELQATQFQATPNRSGGYDCHVTVTNMTDYMMESSLYCLMYGAGGESDTIDYTLAEAEWFDRGASNIYSFEVPADMVAGGDCEIIIEYTFY